MTPEPANQEQHLGMVQMMTSAFNGKHELRQVVSEGDLVAISGSWSGKHSGEFNGVPATGKDIRFSWMDMFHIVDGKVKEEYFEMNPGSIMMQIGGSNS
jgi:predicted ester cyclase